MEYLEVVSGFKDMSTESASIKESVAVLKPVSATFPSRPVVCHLSSAHEWFDERIFHKQCKALARAGYDVRFIVPTDQSFQQDGVSIIPGTRPASKLGRLTLNLLRVFKLALRQEAAVYQIHDPELLVVAVMLCACGKTVVYDAHEDYEQKLRSRRLPRGLNVFLPKALWWFESLAAARLAHIFTADGHTQKKFPAGRATTLGNFPPSAFGEVTREPAKENSPFRIIYLGGLTRERGLVQVIEALNYLQDLNLEFHIAGETRDGWLREQFKRPRVVYHGRIPWQEVNRFLAVGDVGVVMLQPMPAYTYCPGENIVKLWEYLAVGLPVIISDFPMLRALVARLDCGLVADPTSPKAIAEAVRKLYMSSAERRRLGENGRRAVCEEYNWETQERKLLAVYARLMGTEDVKAS